MVKFVIVQEVKMCNQSNNTEVQIVFDWIIIMFFSLFQKTIQIIDFSRLLE